MGLRARRRTAAALILAVAGAAIPVIGILTQHWEVAWETAVTIAVTVLAGTGALISCRYKAKQPATGSAVNAPEPPTDGRHGDGDTVFRGSGSAEADASTDTPRQPLAPGSDPSGTERLLVAELPAHAELGRDISLIIRITTVVPDDPLAAMAPLPKLMISERGTPVTLVVLAPRGLVSEESLEQVIWVYPGQDPQPIRIPFRARDVGLQRLRVTAWAGGTFLCELTAEVSVALGAVSAASPRPQMAGLGKLRAVPGEVTLQISVEAGRYAFQLLSDAYLGRIVHAEALVGDPSRAAEDAIKTLRAMAVGRSGYTMDNARRLMREIGVGLWSEMVPEVVKEEFWRLRGAIGAFSIAAGDGIPWELLYPMAPGSDEGFLVEQFPVLRRAYGQGRSKRLRVADPCFVVSSSMPSDAQSEVETIRRLVGGGGLIRELAELLTVVETGELGLTHFACHNTFRPDGGSVIEMDGGPFTPTLLNSAVAQRSLAGHCPLVFMNACRTAGAIPEYTHMVGWAQQFMGAGAGAFVGTLWAVRSESARAFAEAFYERIIAGLSLGEAVLQARQQVRGTDSDPTWLAYSAYGDPAATIGT
jgi:hypothetical protein